MISYILAIITSVILLVCDAITKVYIMSNFSLGESAPFLKGVVDIVYIHNKGAAWGVLSGQTVILLVLTALVMLFCIFFLWKYAKKSKLLFWAVCLVLAGGLGNMYDRIFRDGKVVDFLHFEFWPQFPVFNVADCGVVIGAGLLILYFIIDTIKEYKQKKQGSNADN